MMHALLHAYGEGGIEMAKHVKTEISKDTMDKIYEAVEIANNTGKVRKGVNETTKCLERGLAKMVVVASDVTPEEVVMHLPVLCNEKKVLCVEVPSKLELGKAAGIEVGTSSVAIEEMGDSKKLLEDVKRKLEAK
jgi:large subunit ribosomal protein L7Ae